MDGSKTNTGADVANASKNQILSSTLDIISLKAVLFCALKCFTQKVLSRDPRINESCGCQAIEKYGELGKKTKC